MEYNFNVIPKFKENPYARALERTIASNNGNALLEQTQSMAFCIKKNSTLHTIDSGTLASTTASFSQPLALVGKNDPWQCA